MSVVAAAVAADEMRVEELGVRLVGRHIFKDGQPMQLSAYKDGQLVSTAGPVSMLEASNALLPEPGSIVLVHGQEMVWLEPLFGSANCLYFLAVAGNSVETSMVTDPAAVMVLEDREKEDPRTVGLLLAQHRAFEAWKSALNCAANEYAEDNDLCERYDQFMEQNGLEGRTNDYEAEITITITRAIRGWNFERASDDITSEDIARWVTDERDLEWSVEEG